MTKEELGVGDIVYSKVAILNDGTVPEATENELLAKVGNRGVLMNIGHVEMDPSKLVYLVSFYKEDGSSGPLVGCGKEEISQEPVPST